jgi:nucleotide-binding universal stress UspA family protein
MNERGVMFSRILVAIDGSQISMNAANYALSIAAKHRNSQLTVLHIIYHQK